VGSETFPVRSGVFFSVNKGDLDVMFPMVNNDCSLRTMDLEKRQKLKEME
jgi:hypothetical protein